MKKEWQRVILFEEPDADYSYTGLLRLVRAYEGFGDWQVLVDISNGERPGRALIERNDKLPRLPNEFEPDIQKELIEAAMNEINLMTDDELEHIENNKIGFRYRQKIVKWHLLPEE